MLENLSCRVGGRIELWRSSAPARARNRPCAGLDRAPTTHEPLQAWVRRVAGLTTPDRAVWCDGSEREWRSLTDALVEVGTRLA
jgi:GTP-dependent phosphoenolpyruvate carboxykinase